MKTRTFHLIIRRNVPNVIFNRKYILIESDTEGLKCKDEIIEATDDRNRLRLMLDLYGVGKVIYTTTTLKRWCGIRVGVTCMVRFDTEEIP